MELALSGMIGKIDAFAENVLSIPTVELMGRSGKAVASAIRELLPDGGRVIILAGKGNNGGDGYAAATELCSDYSVTIYDVFGKGQRSDAGKFWYNKCRSAVIEIKTVESSSDLENDIMSASLLVDAIFGTGFKGDLPPELITISAAIGRSRAKKLAIDVPLGIDADTGCIYDGAVAVDATVALSYVKPGLVSYPAKEYVGRLIFDTIGIDRAKISEKFEFTHILTDEKWASQALPYRRDNSNKGSFGKALIIAGSDKYRGAAHLALSAALRAGAGYVGFVGSQELCAELRASYPEAIYLSTDYSTEHIKNLSSSYTATLIGSGSDSTESLYSVVESLVTLEGSPLILDADAINAISRYGTPEILRHAKRTVIMTPHPLEFARLINSDLGYVQAHRIECAVNFAREYGVILLLKGAATVITDGERVFINGSGSSALAKAGSGDVLAGIVTSLLAFSDSPLDSVALAAYIHGRAGENLARELSDFGVTPSDIPKEACRVISMLQK